MTHPLTDEMIEEMSYLVEISPWYELHSDDYDNDCRTAGMRAAYDKGRDDQLEQVIDAWNDAIQEEAECGVKFHSEKRAADMKRDYPILTRFGVVLESMRPT